MILDHATEERDFGWVFDAGNFHARGFDGNDKMDHCAHIGLARDVLKSHIKPRWKTPKGQKAKAEVKAADKKADKPKSDKPKSSDKPKEGANKTPKDKPKAGEPSAKAKPKDDASKKKSDNKRSATASR